MGGPGIHKKYRNGLNGGGKYYLSYCVIHHATWGMYRKKRAAKGKPLLLLGQPGRFASLALE